MNGLVAQLVSTRGQAASDVYHAVLLRGLLNGIGRTAGPLPKAGATSADDFGWLLRVPARQLVRESTPFVWLNVHRLLRSNQNGDDACVAHARHLAMTSFDAYFHLVPDGTSVTLNGNCGSAAILLPRLGVQVRAAYGDSVLVRRSATTLTIDTSERHLCIDLGTPSLDTRLTSVPLPFCPSSLFLPVRDLAFFETQYIEEIIGEENTVHRFPQNISNALRMIAEIDPELESRISSVIHWYVPIRSPNPEMHCSFTSPQLNGVVFLSFAENVLVLAEAIVHEFGHTELNTLMDTETLSCEEPSERFYSPWRTDPRPLTGLIHALHVFTGVAEFLRRAANTSCMASHRAYLETQGVAIYHKLRIGLKQVPCEKLTPMGLEIIEDIGQRLRVQERNMGNRVDEVPNAIREHLDAWKAEHRAIESVVPGRR